VNEQITIGAGVTFTELVDHPLLQKHAPLLVQASQQIGSVLVRNRATLGGNIANAAGGADSLPPLVCLEAQAIIATAQGEQSMPVAELITGPGRTKLPPGALIRAFVFALPPANSRAAYERIGRRQAMSIARLALAALGVVDATGTIADIRLAPGAALAQVRRIAQVEHMLLGQMPSPELWAAAGRRMAEIFMAESGKRWSAPYKERALAALTERALAHVFPTHKSQFKQPNSEEL
jgi:CO/xanthine dehydrogenase FAD-binding subunit